ncbi:MAG: glycerol-3-phosphate dehydrogenase [Cyanobacteria bacterium J06621_8]
MRDFTTIEKQAYDVVIIGGGINGAGVARDAATRGLKTILVEKNDFASGTSSWSSRLIHGGLRYLEYFEFPLVREALKEREVLFHTAPHLVNPLLLTIPMYRDRSRPYWKIWAGMILYDIFSFDKTVPLHRMLPKLQFKRLFNSTDPEGLAGGAQYYDGQVCYAERLCLENIIAAQEAGATVLNYAKVTKLNRQNSSITTLSCEDVLTGAEFTIQGHDKTVVINTSGPWVDDICQLGEESGNSAPIGKTKKIGGTKGSHIIVERFPGAPETAFYVEAKSDGRPFFIIPWLDMYLIGTTDLKYDGDLDKIKASNEEIDYLLTETNNVIATANLTRADIKFTYSGVRPLPNEEGKKAGSITRKHILYDHKKEGINNLISLIGGKLTTYRNVGEEMVDAVYRKRKEKAPGCVTDQEALPGYILPSDPRIASAINEFGDRINLKSMAYLFSVYGLKTFDILDLVNSNPELGEKITDDQPDIKAQIVYAVNNEFAQTLVDITRRRTALAIKTHYGLNILPVIIEVLKQYCDWSQEKCDRLYQDYCKYMEDNCIPDYQIKQLANL